MQGAHPCVPSCWAGASSCCWSRRCCRTASGKSGARGCLAKGSPAAQQPEGSPAGVQRTERRAEGYKNNKRKKEIVPRNCLILSLHCLFNALSSKVGTKESAAQTFKARPLKNILKNSEHICTYINIHICVKHSAHMTNDELSPLFACSHMFPKQGREIRPCPTVYLLICPKSINSFCFVLFVFFYKNLQMLNLMSFLFERLFSSVQMRNQSRDQIHL